MNVKLDIFSPTTGEKYEMAYALRKGIVRSELRAKNFSIVRLHKDFYGSGDYAIKVSEFGPSESLWMDSINWQIDGIIPMHQTAGGKLSFGWQCGCDFRHGGQFPTECEPDNPKWENYKKLETGHITFWVKEKTQDVLISEIKVDSPEAEVLNKIVQQYVARQVFQTI